MHTDPDTNGDASTITATCTVDAVMARSPAARDILNAHNVDTCCGGADTLAAAAARAHVDAGELVALLSAAPHDVRSPSIIPPPASPSCSCGCR